MEKKGRPGPITLLQTGKTAQRAIVALANKFHRVDECGKIEYKETDGAV